MGGRGKASLPLPLYLAISETGSFYYAKKVLPGPSRFTVSTGVLLPFHMGGTGLPDPTQQGVGLVSPTPSLGFS